MELSLPADIYVLRVMSDGEPNNPVRVKHLITERYETELQTEWGREPWTRAYISQVMSRLKDRELLERVPPENSGLYRISDLGYAALYRYQTQGETQFSFRDLMDTAAELSTDPDPVPDDATLSPSS